MVAAIIGILIALLLPAFSRVRSRARATQGFHNLRQLHEVYLVKKQEAVPWLQFSYEDVRTDKPASEPYWQVGVMSGWPGTWLQQAGGGRGLFVCPEDKTQTNVVPLGLFNIYDRSNQYNSAVVCVRSIWEPGKTYNGSNSGASSFRLYSKDFEGAYVLSKSGIRST